MMLYPAGGYCAEYFPLVAVTPPPPTGSGVSHGPRHEPFRAPPLRRIYATAELTLPRFDLHVVAAMRTAPISAAVHLLMPVPTVTVTGTLGRSVVSATATLVLRESGVLAMAAIRDRRR